MKPQRAHLAGMVAFNLRDRLATLRRIASRRVTFVAFAVTFFALSGNFLLIPNISAYLQFNLGYPRAGLSLLYACGGCMSFFTSRTTGNLIDRYGAFSVSLCLIACLLPGYYLLFIDYHPIVPIVLLFTLIMMLNTGRYVAVTTTVSKVPAPHERAGFMSLMTALQNLGITVAAFLSSIILVQRPDGALDHMTVLAIMAMIGAASIPLFIWWLEAHLRRQANPEIAQALEATGTD